MGKQIDQEFLGEARELLDTLGQNLLRYEKAMQAGGKIDPDFCNSAFRAAHNLRGLTGLFGKETLSKLSYGLEILLDRLRKSDIKSLDSASVFDVIFEALGKLNALLGSKTKGTKNIDRLLIKLQRISVYKVTKTTQPKKAINGKRNILKEVWGFLTEYEEFRLQENIKNGLHIIKVYTEFDLANFDSKLPELMNWLKNQGEIITTLPSDKEIKSDKIGFDLWVATSTDPNKLAVSLRERSATLKVAMSGRSRKKVKNPKK